VAESDVADRYQPLQPVPETGYIYRTSWPLATGDIDAQHRIRLDGVARYIQEVGAEHLLDAGAGDLHPHWIVQRTVIDVLEPLQWPNTIRFRRWCSGISSRWCTMRVRLDGAEGGLVETEGFWINMNKDTQMPSLISDDFFNRVSTTTDNHRLKWRPWLDASAVTEICTPFPLRYTDIDHFQHVNNTVYWHGVHEVLAQEDDFDIPYRAVVEYRKPIAPAAPVHIHSVRVEDELRMWFVVGDEVHASALVRPLPG